MREASGVSGDVRWAGTHLTGAIRERPPWDSLDVSCPGALLASGARSVGYAGTERRGLGPKGRDRRTAGSMLSTDGRAAAVAAAAQPDR